MVNLIGLYCLGQHCSTIVDEFVKQMQSNAIEHPVSNATLVILNNTTKLGTPMEPSPELRKASHNCRETVTLKFLATDTLPVGSATHGMRCTLHFAEESLVRSPDREGSCKFRPVCSSNAENSHPIHILQKPIVAPRWCCLGDGWRSSTQLTNPQ